MIDPSRKRILYIDSDTETSSLFRTIMEQEGYSVDLSSTGEEGLALFRDDPHPLVITGQCPDGIAGLEILRELKNHDSDPVLMLIVDNADDAIIVEALKLGVQRCIPRIDETIYTEVLPTVIDRLQRRLAPHSSRSRAGWPRRRCSPL